MWAKGFRSFFFTLMVILISISILSCGSDESESDVEISTFTVPRANISIDGNMDDWDSITPVFIDDVNDEDSEADFEGTDLDEFFLARDDTHLYLMISLNDGEPNTAAQYTFEMVPEAGGSGQTGDYLALAYNRNNKWLASVHVRDSSNLNVSYPSDHVGIGDSFIEWKVLLSDFHFFNDRYVTVYIHNHTPIFYPVSDYKKTGIKLVLD